jgi:hypothetical protein
MAECICEKRASAQVEALVFGASEALGDRHVRQAGVGQLKEELALAVPSEAESMVRCGLVPASGGQVADEPFEARVGVHCRGSPSARRSRSTRAESCRISPNAAARSALAAARRTRVAALRHGVVQ